MTEWQLKTPVALLIFNRPDTTEKVFETIRQAKPPKLLVVADGPRADRAGEAQKCAAARAIVERIDWDCQVFKNYSETNLGCRHRVSSGLDWVFETVEEAIILEDDCLPHPSFFRFCEELLERYRHVTQVFSISGNNLQLGNNPIDESYYFSGYTHIWGWATWRRTWQLYDLQMKEWERLKGENWLESIFDCPQASQHWSRIFQLAHDGFDTWDYSLVFACWLNQGVTILPKVNLVSNIGFGEDATHTKSAGSLSNLPAQAIEFPLKHPSSLDRNIPADNFTEKHLFSGGNTLKVLSKNTSLNLENQNSMNLTNLIYQNAVLQRNISKVQEALGRIEKRQLKSEKSQLLRDYEFRVFSQWGEDGIIQFLIERVLVENKIFVEFGVENYQESNTRFLLVENNWSGLVIDGSEQNINYIKSDSIYWQYNLKAVQAFVTRENINHLITSNGIKGEIGLLSIDIDGNDYWVWKAINSINPAIVIIEYNSRFGKEKAVTIPYNPKFVRSQAHYSMIYYGASLQALYSLANQKGYIFVGCNSAGNNAFFIRRDLKPDSISGLTVKQGYVAGQYRESRNERGQLIYLSNSEEQAILSTLPVVEVESEENTDSNILQTIQTSSIRVQHDSTKSINGKFLVDGIFFQLYQTGIARLWRSLLEVWSKTDFAKQLLVVDREGTAPKIPGLKYYCIPKYDYNQPEVDRQTLQKICDEESIDIFVSSYYTTPVTTPSVFMAYDMIPEVAGYDLTIPMWREKTYAIQHASSYVAISENTAKDLIRFFPNISQDSITVAYCGVSHIFTPASSLQVQNFKQKYGIDKPYFMLAGMRIGYKNASLFFKAFSQLPNKQDFEIVCTGGGSNLEGEFQSYVLGIKVHLLQLSDEELSAAYSGATALAFPSQYEGFGLPVLEAMACGCPVITCPQSSLPEVGGNAVIYVNARDIFGMVNALREVQKSEVRHTLVSAGLERCKQFSWSTMAEKVREALLTAANSQQASPRESLPFSEEIKTQIQAYQNTFDRASLSTLRETRHKLAQHWLNLPSEQLERDYKSELGKLHLEFWNSGFKNEILADEEKIFVQQLSAKVARGFNEPDAIQSLLASTLYFYPHQISLQYQRAPIPNWFAPSYMQFMFESPRLFKEVGEVERYADYFCGWIDYLHGNIIANPESEVWKYVTSVFTNAANLTPLYFSNRDLKETQEKRAEILELSLTQKGCQLDYTFPDRSPERTKIRVGILCQNFYPSAETFTVLPVFEHLDRHQFELYLYALDVSNTASEQFARNCSDRFTHLNSQNLSDWVQTIRTDDLDITLIGSNITARSYPFTLLSMHRLARIQTVSLADPVTTGMRNIDRYIAGNLTVSQTAQNSYREQLVKIQGSGLCFRFPPDPAPTLNPTRQSWGATEETIVYISGSNFRKINPEVRHTWAKILSAVPNSILALYPFGPNWGRHPQLELPFYQQMQATLAQYGVATNRFVLIKTLPTTADIQKCLEIADIYLDSYPYSGAASALDPLKIGLPLVTMEGIELRHRQSAALLQELQIPDLIARSEAEYIQLAVSLGTNPQLRQQKRQDIQAKMQQTPQFLDSKAYGWQIGKLLQNLFSDRKIQPTETAIANDRWVVTPEILNRICGCLNLYKIDPSDNTTLTTLRQLRHQLSESLLNLTAKELENLYESDIGKAYQAYLKSGMQKEPLEANEQSFLQQLTQQGVGLTNPKALNALMGAMLYYAPGTMKVHNYRDRLPTWFIPDYEQVFEQNPTPASSAPTQNPSPSPSSDIPQLSTEFLNRLLGCVNLYEIDPSESSTIVELHQLRRKLAEYWLNLPLEQLETVYKTEVGQRYNSLLKSGFQKEAGLETDRLFMQEITQIASSTAHPKSLNAMLAAMLYYPPDRLKLQNARTRLPDWLINDYEQVFARV